MRLPRRRAVRRGVHLLARDGGGAGELRVQGAQAGVMHVPGWRAVRSKLRLRARRVPVQGAA